MDGEIGVHIRVGVGAPWAIIWRCSKLMYTFENVVSGTYYYYRSSSLENLYEVSIVVLQCQVQIMNPNFREVRYLNIFFQKPQNDDLATVLMNSK